MGIVTKMANEKFCLRWNDFESNINIAFRELRGDKDFFDVTLACDDEQIQAHKMILSACSPFFRTILRRNPHTHPLLYLKGVKYADLHSVLNFMYHGEVNIKQEELNSFLAVAEDLRVKGLTQGQTEPSRAKGLQSTESRLPAPKKLCSTQLASKNQSLSQDSYRSSSSISTTPAFYSTFSSHSGDNADIQEVLPVKTEPRESIQVQGSVVPEEESYTNNESQQLAQLEDDSYGYQDDQHVEYGEYEDPYGDSSMVIGRDQSTYSVVAKGPGNDRSSLLQYITQHLEGGSASFQCTLCGKINGQKNNIMNHVESIHFPGSFTYECK